MPDIVKEKISLLDWNNFCNEIDAALTPIWECKQEARKDFLRFSFYSSALILGAVAVTLAVENVNFSIEESDLTYIIFGKWTKIGFHISKLHGFSTHACWFYLGGLGIIILLKHMHLNWIINRKFHESMTSASLICSANGGKYPNISFSVVKKPLLPYCKCMKMNYIDIAVATSDVLEDERSVVSNDTRSVPSSLVVCDSSGDLEADHSSSVAVVSGDMSRVD